MFKFLVKTSNPINFPSNLTIGEMDWDDNELGPFTKKVSKYHNADLEYDSYDGSMESNKNKVKRLEQKSKKISKYNKTHRHPSDEEGGPINPTPGRNKKIVPIKTWKPWKPVVRKKVEP